MTAFVVLLRGINVGGNNKVPMAQLRTALSEAGLGYVRTYIQSGNIVATAESKSTAASVARRVEAVITEEFGITVAVVALTADALRAVVEANPFADQSDPRLVHVLFLLGDAPEDLSERLEALVEKARAKQGGRDRAVAIGSAIYLHTPDGFGTSELAKALSGKRTGIDATARNWRTVLTLLEMVGEQRAEG